MRAKEGKATYSKKEFMPPKPTNPEEKRKRWDQRNAVARADEARQRIADKQQEQADNHST